MTLGPDLRDLHNRMSPGSACRGSQVLPDKTVYVTVSVYRNGSGGGAAANLRHFGIKTIKFGTVAHDYLQFTTIKCKKFTIFLHFVTFLASTP